MQHCSKHSACLYPHLHYKITSLSFYLHSFVRILPSSFYHRLPFFLSLFFPHSQAYAALHHADEAAHYCQQTLTLQLSHASLGGGKGSGATSTADEDAQFYGHGSPEAATAFNPLEWCVGEKF